MACISLQTCASQFNEYYTTLPYSLHPSTRANSFESGSDSSNDDNQSDNEDNQDVNFVEHYMNQIRAFFPNAQDIVVNQYASDPTQVVTQETNRDNLAIIVATLSQQEPFPNAQRAYLSYNPDDGIVSVLIINQNGIMEKFEF
ncbi:MAG TPA: hypothetical protein VLG50_01340 [Candidatus Saccharimonadales bacterium]|nr:hypothetical protein [Candidatus Saccharimonadales bacterium]